MLSLVLLTVCFFAQGFVDSDDDKASFFDKYFSDLTTKKVKEPPMYKMYRWRNLPTLFTQPPPPRGHRSRMGQPTKIITTEEPEDCEGDFKIIPVPKPIGDSHPFLDRHGKRGKKIYKREVEQGVQYMKKEKELRSKHPGILV